MLTTPTTTVTMTDDILFSIRIRTYGGTKSNGAKASEYSANEGAKKKVMGVTEDLFVDDTNLRAVRNHRQTVDNWAKRLGAPWGDKQYYLTATLIPELMQGFDERKAEFDSLISAWLGTREQYEQRVSDALFKRGNLGKRSDYPTYDSLRSRFSMDLFIEPVPVNNVIVQKFKDLGDDLHKHYQRQHERQMQGVLSKLSADMLSILGRLSKGTTDVTVKGKDGKYKTKKGRIFESTLTLANRICQTYRDFNIVSDPALEAARLGLENALRGVTVDNLRTGSTVRTRVKSSVDSLLKTFAPAAAQNIAADDMDEVEDLDSLAGLLDTVDAEADAIAEQHEAKINLFDPAVDKAGFIPPRSLSYAERKAEREYVAAAEHELAIAADGPYALSEDEDDLKQDDAPDFLSLLNQDEEQDEPAPSQESSDSAQAFDMFAAFAFADAAR